MFTVTSEHTHPGLYSSNPHQHSHMSGISSGSAAVPIDSVADSDQKPNINNGSSTPYISLSTSSYINPPSLLTAQVNSKFISKLMLVFIFSTFLQLRTYYINVDGYFWFKYLFVRFGDIYQFT